MTSHPASVALKSTWKMNKQTGEKFQRWGLKFSFQVFDILNGMEMTAEIVVGGEEQVFKLEN